MSEALRTLFTELGFEVDDTALKKADAAVKETLAGIKKLVGWTDAADKSEAVLAARRKARAAVQHQAAVQTAADAAKTHGPQGLAREVGYFEKLRELAAAQAKQRADAVKAANDMEADAKARRLLGLGDAPQFDSFGARKQQGATSFDGKFGADKWKAAAKPVEGLLDVVVRFEKKASAALGQRLPASVQALLTKLGVAKGDFAAMGQIAAGVAGTVVEVVRRTASAAFDFTAEFTAASEALRETARNARVTSSELQALQHAGTVSGVGADRMTSSITALGQKLRDANSHLAGSSGVVHTLRRLGISARDASGQIRPTLDILDDVAELQARTIPAPQNLEVGLSRGTLSRQHGPLLDGEPAPAWSMSF